MLPRLQTQAGSLKPTMWKSKIDSYKFSSDLHRRKEERKDEREEGRSEGGSEGGKEEERKEKR